MGKMSLRRKKSQSPLRQKPSPAPSYTEKEPIPIDDRRPSRPRTRYRTWYRVPDAVEPEHHHDQPSPGYYMEWNDQGCRRRRLVDTEDLRRRLLIARGGGNRRRSSVPDTDCSSTTTVVVVNHDDLGPHLRHRVADVLVEDGAVDTAFLEAHAHNRPWVRRGRSGAGMVWEYPEPTGCGGTWFRRASLWTTTSLAGGMVAVLLVHDSSGSGSDGQSIDAELYDCLDGTAADRLLGEIVYRRWIDFLSGGISIAGVSGEPTLWAALSSLERNQDSSRFLAAPSDDEPSPYAVWTALEERVHGRLALLSMRHQHHTHTCTHGAPPTKTREGGGGNSGEEKGRSASGRRALDRLSYLGGVLLPVTVVSSIVSISGKYGPGGSRFWVFWLASVLGSVGAVIVIYLDQVRTLPVWIEVAVDAALEESDAEGCPSSLSSSLTEDGGGLADRVEAEKRAANRLVIQRLQMAGGEPLVRAWRRRDLGWGGALKKVSGYYRWRGLPKDMVFQVPPRAG